MNALSNKPLANAIGAYIHVIIMGLIMLAVWSCSAAPAASQGRNCGPRDAIVVRLAEGYGETRQAMGLGANNSVLEIFAADDTGTWTITITSPNGVTCLVASGQAYEPLREKLPAKGSDL